MAEGTRVCPRCNEARPDVDFPPRGRSCLACRRAGVRRHYARNRKYYLDKARARQQRVVAETRDWLIAYLETHPCVDCGASDIRVLEFDHRDPTTKVTAVAVLARGGYSLARVQAEVALCDVRCANCHRVRTHSQRGWWGAQKVLQGSKITKRARQDSNLQPPDP